MNTPPPAGEEWRAFDGPEALLHRTAADDAALRAARANIERIRKRDFALTFVGRDGRPLANTPIDIVQRRHSFPFGDQLWGLDRFAREGIWNTDLAIAWRTRFAEMFNASTSLCYWTERPQNDASKTEDRQGEPRIENFAQTVDWSLSNGLIAKGHPLFWSIPKCVPDWAKRYPPETFWKFAEVRVRSLVARFRGRIRYWDAVNEALWEATPEHLASRQWPHIEPMPALVGMISPILRWCREEDPDATFIINDYGTEQLHSPCPNGSDGSVVSSDTQRARFIALANALTDAGTPPDALGLQSHTGDWIGPAEQTTIYDEFAASTPIPLHITEFWASTRQLRATGRYSEETLAQAQCEFIRDFVTTAFGHPAIEAFFFWGFLGAAIQWEPLHSGHTLRPIWHEIYRLLHEEWTTRLSLTTDAQGSLSFRGFPGDYALRHALGATTRGSSISLTEPGSLTVKLPL